LLLSIPPSAAHGRGNRLHAGEGIAVGKTLISHTMCPPAPRREKCGSSDCHVPKRFLCTSNRQTSADTCS
jgi:hypothetical protein